MEWARRLGGRTMSVAPGAALITLCAMGFALVYVLTVRTTPGRQLGDASLRGALLGNSDTSGAVARVLGVVSVATLLAGIAVIALLALARLQRVAGLVAVGLVVAANASTWLLKNLLLSRPDLGLRELTPATLNSLPSGHTTAAFSVVVAVLFVVPAGWRRAVAAAGGTVAVVIALATMSAGWHRAGDSIAAFLEVGVWSGIAALVVASFTTSTPSHPERLVGRWPKRLGAMTAGSVGVGLLLTVGLLLVGPLRASTAGAVAAFLAGGAFIVATAVVVLLGALLVIEHSDR